MTSEGQLRIGTSGWVYKHWLDIFYVPGLSSAEQLQFYAAHFDTVEVNNSFYRLPARAVFEAWRETAPPGFLFAVKGSRYLSHLKKLKEPEEPLALLMERAGGLGDTLGPILFQLPPGWHVNLVRLERFVAALGAYPTQRYTMEFRDKTWLRPEVYELLQRAGVALCLPVGWGVPLDVRLTASWTYIRMHSGRETVGYGEEELRLWASRIEGFRQQGVDVYVYFNNDPDGYALRDAERLRRLLSGDPSQAAHR